MATAYALRFIPRVLGLVSISLTVEAQSSVVVSQVYGGGGNVGASFRNDFVELFNRGSVAVSIAGWTLQYASASGSSWDRATLSGALQPGQYYLIQLAQGNGGSTGLPSPDAVAGINLSATSGKVALVNTANLLSGSSPSGSQVVDFVGYGEANFAEGGRSAPELSNTTAALRRSGGCIDTNNNQSDFATSQPTPRSTRSPVAACSTIPVPEISAAGVTNGASFLAGPVAPGEILTLFGSGLGPETLATLQLTADRLFVTKSLAATRVLFDGVPAAIIYALAGQVSAIAPYSLDGRTTTDLQVEYQGRLSNRVTLQVAPTAPGIFTLDSSGSGQGAILNQNGDVNGPANPAAAGSVVIIYATGGGQTVPGGDDGRITTVAARQVQNVSVRIGDADAVVEYAGAAPGLVNGAMQINARIPESLIRGNQPVRITVSGATSQAEVVVSVAGR